MARDNEDILVVSPTCPNCDLGKTFTRDTATDYEFENEDANAYCKNCNLELYVPPKWFAKNNWRDNAETF